MTAAGKPELQWQRSIDSFRGGGVTAYVYMLSLDDGTYFVVVESGVSEWRWTRSADNRDVLELGTRDYATAEECMLVVEQYVKTGARPDLPGAA